ncbi:MAG: EAL domain-containing protein [Acidobacteriota bacterium]
MMRRVLFVDDDARVTRAIRRSLRGQPYEILTANSAREALQELAKQEVAVIVSDEKMPEMHGSELLATVLERYPNTVRLILTGQANLDAAIDAINRAQVHRFLQKPCSPEDLAFWVCQALETRERRQRYEAWKATVDAEDEGARVRLDRALSNAWIAFQPIFTTTEQRIFGYEALMRLEDPTVAQPKILFELADRLDRVLEVERLLRNMTAERIADSPPGVRFFVNLHPRCLDDESMLSGDEPLARFAGRIVFEITERVSLHEVTDVRTKVARLRGLGFCIAVDDLGAGYSGFASLALLDPEIVKFDIAMIRDIHLVPRKAKMLASVIGLCRELGIRTVAEGIETEDEKRKVVQLGCDLLQGFHMARPSPDFQKEETYPAAPSW